MTVATPEPDIVRADPRLRREALVLLLGAAVVGSVVIGAVVPWLVRALEDAVMTGRVSNRNVCLAFLGFVAANGLGVIGIGFWITSLGRRIVEAGRFPLAGARVIRDTRVVTGHAATVVGRGQQVLGALLVLLATLLVGLCVYAFRYIV